MTRTISGWAKMPEQCMAKVSWTSGRHTNRRLNPSKAPRLYTLPRRASQTPPTAPRMLTLSPYDLWKRTFRRRRLKIQLRPTGSSDTFAQCIKRTLVTLSITRHLMGYLLQSAFQYLFKKTERKFKCSLMVLCASPLCKKASNLRLSLPSCDRTPTFGRRCRRRSRSPHREVEALGQVWKCQKWIGTQKKELAGQNQELLETGSGKALSALEASSIRKLHTSTHSALLPKTFTQGKARILG
mmetsp:Transcript_10883/g.36706  ORF Transcript_10883/g.36706 Transcript_10883/m.36706 type:complete len:241 (-) Transcript_10883:1877-2599(-)